MKTTGIHLPLWTVVALCGTVEPTLRADDSEFTQYQDTKLSGIVAGVISKSLAECRSICIARSGCAGFDYAPGKQSCRLFAAVSSATTATGSSAETRIPIPGYLNASTAAADCKKYAAPRIHGEGVAYAGIPIPKAVDVCRKASESPSSTGDTWAYYARALEKAGRIKDAIVWAKKSADRGNPIGQWFLGTLYEDQSMGVDAKTSRSEAVRYYQMSSDAGYALAQNNLGWLYANGRGVPTEPDRALALYQLAAAQGCPQAQNNLGTMYYNGDVVPQNYPEAVRLFRLSSDQGNDIGQFDLGLAYEHGRGVNKDRSEAARLYRLAAAQGNSTARERLDGLGAE